MMPVILSHQTQWSRTSSQLCAPKTHEHPEPESSPLFLLPLHLPRASLLTGDSLRKTWGFIQTKLPVVAHTVFPQAEWQSCTIRSNFFKTELGFEFLFIIVTREEEKKRAFRSFSFFNEKPYSRDFFVFQVKGNWWIPNHKKKVWHLIVWNCYGNNLH